MENAVFVVQLCRSWTKENNDKLFPRFTVSE